MVSAVEVKRLALSVEEELFAYYGEVDTKYKHKYRTLITHLKDPKNKVSILFLSSIFELINELVCNLLAKY
jgi:hypothetical protein